MGLLPHSIEHGPLLYPASFIAWLLTTHMEAFRDTSKVTFPGVGVLTLTAQLMAGKSVSRKDGENSGRIRAVSQQCLSSSDWPERGEGKGATVRTVGES